MNYVSCQERRIDMTDVAESTNSDLLCCPVCKDLYIQPRILRCGHTLCTPCSLRLEDMTREDHGIRDMFTSPSFECPVCRQCTVTPTLYRPINRNILDLLREMPSYEAYVEQYESNGGHLYTSKVPRGSVDLAFVSSRARKAMANSVYDEIYPALYRAACDGKSKITFRDAGLVADATVVFDKLSNILMIRHNVYRVAKTSSHFTVHFLPIDQYSQYKNEEFFDPDTVQHDDDAGGVVSDR